MARPSHGLTEGETSAMSEAEGERLGSTDRIRDDQRSPREQLTLLRPTRKDQTMNERPVLLKYLAHQWATILGFVPKPQQVGAMLRVLGYNQEDFIRKKDGWAVYLGRRQFTSSSPPFEPETGRLESLVRSLFNLVQSGVHSLGPVSEPTRLNGQLPMTLYSKQIEEAAPVVREIRKNSLFMKRAQMSASWSLHS